jgi:hypothetical protein
MTKERYSVLIALFALLVLYPVKSTAQNIPPIADAGLSRYVAYDPVVLNGTGSYDPDNSGPLSYAWRQIGGPAVIIIDANTATPTVSGFTQTDVIQECEFELVVNDGELTSLPDTVKVIIVPDFGQITLEHENPPFDRDKPTVITFRGGDGRIGSSGYRWTASAWKSRANVISFPNGYGPDSSGGGPTYYKYGDMIIVYLSAVAPDYKQPIQTIGASTGGMPATDVGLRLNRIYRDARYAVNRVTHIETGSRLWNAYLDTNELFLTSSVDGEQCWIDHYYGIEGQAYEPFPRTDILWVRSGLSHGTPLVNWYRNSLTGNDMNKFNSGVVGGAYWSVIGPGKNLQLALHTNAYYFRWDGGEQSGSMNFYNEVKFPGRLPEPVTLVGPVDVGDPNGALLTCEESENAVGYQLLLGRDPYHMVYLFSDTPSAPTESVTAFPFEQCWWTVRAYDEYGSTIHADPMHIKAESVIAQTIENATTGQTYGSIQQAINDAHSGDEIVVSPGVCQYLENINFKGKNLIVRSTDPNDPAVVAATVINGGHRGPVVTVSGTQETDCLLAGLTILGGTVGISCCDASPTIRNCTIESNGPNAIEFWQGYEPPTIIDCSILGQVVEVNDPTLVAHWKLDETEGEIAYDSVGDNDGALNGEPLWQPTGGAVDGALAFDGIDDYFSAPLMYFSVPLMLDPKDAVFSVFAWIKGDMPGQVIISQALGSDWLGAATTNGCLMTELGFFSSPHSRCSLRQLSRMVSCIA